MGVRVDQRADADGALRITQLAPTAHAVAELDPAVEDAVDVDLDVAAARQLAALVEACRVGQADAAPSASRRARW